jgi:hypothetical protein
LSSAAAAPSTVTAAALAVRFFLEACLTRRMVASSVLVNALRVTSLRSAKWASKPRPHFACATREILSEAADGAESQNGAAY